VTKANDTMLGELMRCTIDLAKALPEPWQKLPEAGQKAWLNVVEKQCTSAIERAIADLASQDWPAVTATVDTVTFKSGGVKAAVKISHASRGAHEIADSAGQQVLIIICDPEEFISGEKPIADPDQKSIPLQSEVEQGHPGVA
tara:strand:+ start:21887 stop:22315 length:429 start_codon:yes stop_codon:yes gene_type:complete